MKFIFTDQSGENDHEKAITNDMENWNNIVVKNSKIRYTKGLAIYWSMQNRTKSKDAEIYEA